MKWWMYLADDMGEGDKISLDEREWRLEGAQLKERSELAYLLDQIQYLEGYLKCLGLGLEL